MNEALDRQQLRKAIEASKKYFSEFFKLSNAGMTKQAGMCILEAEMRLTEALIKSNNLKSKQ